MPEFDRLTESVDCIELEFVEQEATSDTSIRAAGQFGFPGTV
jgi:hypothetical protein